MPYDRTVDGLRLFPAYIVTSLTLRFAQPHHAARFLERRSRDLVLLGCDIERDGASVIVVGRSDLLDGIAAEFS